MQSNHNSLHQFRSLSSQARASPDHLRFTVSSESPQTILKPLMNLNRSSGNHIMGFWLKLILGYSRKYPHTPMDDIGNSVIYARWTWLAFHEFPQKFGEFWPEFQENSSKSCKILDFPKNLNQQGLESCINCYCLFWVPNSVSSWGGGIFSGIAHYSFASRNPQRYPVLNITGKF